MAKPRLSMRKCREILRLSLVALLSVRAIARSLMISPSTVGDYVRRASVAGLTWEQIEQLSDQALEQALFSAPTPPPAPCERPLPDWPQVHRELRRKGVTLQLLWEEYKAVHPDGVQYSWFCQRYRDWAATLDVVMRQEHRGAEKLFVDYAGQTVPIVDRNSGEVRQAQVFVATLGASSYTYAEATWSQNLSDWTGSHIRAFKYIGGVPELLVPDNLKSAVERACRYEPDINSTYHELACHYGTAVLPARVRKPRDKAKVEKSVQLVERWILAALRNQTFFTLSGLNSEIARLLERLNNRPFRKLPGSRKSLFEALDVPALKPLPPTHYVFCEWKKVRVNIDYHIEFDGHYYSVPYTLARKELMCRYTSHTVELLHNGERVASHRRSKAKGRHTTVPEHMPEKHRRMGEFTPERLIRWAEKTGPGTAKLIEKIIASRAHPQQAYRSCLGVLRLGKSYGEQRLEAACQRALLLGTYRYRSIESILRKRLDEQPPAASLDDAIAIEHDNIRGPGYYN
jgi:transposase